MTDPFDKTRDRTVLVLGDVMVDAYLWGRVDRISPEAPVPVVHVERRSARLGGAANVALNVAALGARPVVVSVVGDDEHAVRLEQLFNEQGLSTQGIIRSAHRRTTVKTRVISGHQHIVRVDDEQDDDLDAEDAARLRDLFQQLLLDQRPAVVVMEDYDKGVLSKPVIESALEAAHRSGIPVAVDPKRRNFLSYRGADLFKPNLKELREGLKLDLDAADIRSISQAVLELERRLGNRISLITLSEHGVLVHAGTEQHVIAAHRRKIADVSGAGDTVIAVAALALAAGVPVRGIAALANLAGGMVCEEVGVVPIDAERFLSERQRLDLP